MAATGKKGKKSKGKVLSLNEFLSDDHGGPRIGEAVVLAPSKTSWADEMEEEAVYKEKIVLPTAPRAARGSDVDESRIPNNPPYTAYIANLPYDIETEDVIKFFHGLSVRGVRLPREGGEGGRLRGFGYAEFESRQDLVDALAMNELLIKNRKIRVDIASGTDGDQEQGMGMGMGRGRGRPSRNDEEREDRTPSDWRNAPREASSTQERPGFRGGDRDREMGSRYESGFNPRDRPPGSSFGPRRDAPPSYGRDRDGPPSYGRDRDGPSSFGRDRDYGRDRDGQPSYGRDRDGPSYGRDREGPSSFGRDRDGPYGRDREGPSFGRDRDGAYGRDREAPFSRSERPAEREPAKERPKLALKPRSVPAEEAASAPAVAIAAAAAPAAASAASIFGGAKPVDTTAREREIEERLKEKEALKEREAHAPRGRETDRAEGRSDRDTSRGSGRGRSVDEEREPRRDYDDEPRRSRDGPDSRPPRDGDYKPPRSSGPNDYRPPRDGDYRPPARSEGRGEYRPPARGGASDRDYRPPREGDYRPPRRDDEPRRDNGVSRGPPPAGSYRAPTGGSRSGGLPNQSDRSHERDTEDRGDRRPAQTSSSSNEERVRKLEEPKAPVFENRNKFAFLLAEDEAADESEEREEQ